LGETLGTGGFGETRAAHDTRDGTDVVVKELTVKGLPSWKPVEHFEREVRTLRSLDHPSIPKLVDAFEDDDGDTVRLFIVSARIHGRSLGRCIDDGDRWSEADARTLLDALLETLIYLHGLSPRVIHRDIKPQNIILDGDGSPYLVDFGAVRDLVAHQPGGEMTVLGTPGYMAPEQALGSADARSDIYGLGATMLHVLTHRHPTDLPREDMRFSFEKISGLPAGVVTVIMRMVEPDPAARFQSAEAVRAALDGEIPALVAVSADGPLAPGSEVDRLAPRHLRPETPRSLDTTTKRELNMHNALLPYRRKLSLAMLLVAAGAVALAALGLGGALTIPLLLFTTAFAYFGLGKRNQLRQRELFRKGTETRGEMFAARQGQQGVYVDYRYSVQDSEYRGTLYTSDAMVSSRVRPGMPVRVFYDEGDASQHLALVDRDEIIGSKLLED
jgi:serine/threonine protein kinase